LAKPPSFDAVDAFVEVLMAAVLHRVAAAVLAEGY
jgi:hypothetical protein